MKHNHSSKNLAEALYLVAEKNEVQYFPTMLITKEGKNSEYEGPRSFASMKEFLENY